MSEQEYIDTLIESARKYVKADRKVPVDLLGKLHRLGVELDVIYQDSNLGFEIFEVKTIDSFDEVEA
jgi:hypothetical protein